MKTHLPHNVRAMPGLVLEEVPDVHDPLHRCVPKGGEAMCKLDIRRLYSLLYHFCVLTDQKVERILLQMMLDDSLQPDVRRLEDAGA